MDYSKILNDVKNDSIYQKNILYGKPRNEHPEGTILAHINELTGNLDKIKCYITKEEYEELAFLIHVHDICKPDIAQNPSLRKKTNHQTLAKDFASRFTNDKDILAMIQYHDENFFTWRQFQSTGTYDKKHLNIVLSQISNLRLYIIFTFLDGATQGKDVHKLTWFYNEVLNLGWKVEISEEIFYALGLEAR